METTLSPVKECYQGKHTINLYVPTLTMVREHPEPSFHDGMVACATIRDQEPVTFPVRTGGKRDTCNMKHLPPFSRSCTRSLRTAVVWLWGLDGKLVQHPEAPPASKPPDWVHDLQYAGHWALLGSLSAGPPSSPPWLWLSEPTAGAGAVWQHQPRQKWFAKWSATTPRALACFQC